jgi:D-alanine-D-alanine ligase
LKPRRPRLALFTSTCLKTSTGSTSTVLNLLNALSEVACDISVVLIDDLIPKQLRISQRQLRRVVPFVPFSRVRSHPRVKAILRLDELTLHYLRKNFDFAIVAVYNAFGEDGRLVGLLETIGIPYLSPSLKTSAICFDKQFTKAVLIANGIDVPRGFEIYVGSGFDSKAIDQRVQEAAGYPVVVKANSCGASRGVTLVRSAGELNAAIAAANDYSQEILIEEFIAGDEFSVGVIGHFTDPVALPVVMIRCETPIFDYVAKYEPGRSEELCPAPIDALLSLALQREAVKAYRAVKCDSHGRVDLRCDKGRIVVLEINTFPGLLPASIFPKQLKVAGTSLERFLHSMIPSRSQRKVRNKLIAEVRKALLLT